MIDPRIKCSDDGSLDEVHVSDAKAVHLEFMDDETVVIGIEREGGGILTIELYAEAPVHGFVLPIPAEED